MMQIFETLSNSALATWVLEADTIWAFPSILTLHTFGFMVLVGSCWALDLRLLGFGRQIPLNPLTTLFRVIWVAFALNALTGLVLFVAEASTRGPSLLFWSKLIFVATGIISTVRIERELVGAGPEAVTVSAAAKRLAAISFVSWTAAIIAGRLLAYVA